MPTPNGPLQEFFSQFNFQRYTYDPHTPASGEFKRLCQARQWGPSRIREHETEFLLAVEKEERPLQEFFRQFNFQGYTYNPHTPASEEFKRLCQARQWGPSKIRKHETEFLLAVEREQDLRPLQAFFSQFNFHGYTYDPYTPALEEFESLCQARQWGPSKIGKHETAFWHAVGRGQDPRESPAGHNVIEFFSEYGCQRFTYDLDDSIQSEFQRLVKLRGWGEVNLSKVTKRFNEAVMLDATEQLVYSASEATDSDDPEEATDSDDLEEDTDSEDLEEDTDSEDLEENTYYDDLDQYTFPEDPEEDTYSEDLGTEEVDLLADWLTEQECPGFTYYGGLPELAFKELVRVKGQEWDLARMEEGLDIEDEEWKDSVEFMLLRTEFYEVVEEAFNLLLGKFCQITRFKPWQVLVGLYGPEIYGPEQGMGLESIGKRAAKIILQNVFINIFDFLDAFQEILKDPPTTDRWELLQRLRPLAIELQFPNNSLLGVYSALTNRVFPLQIAKEEGTLALLLHRIRVFLKGFRDLVEGFEEEAGYELQEAEEEGRVGIRRLLLSREWACLQPLRARQQAVPF
ncbi:hypothetical protein B9Z19DRAFT_327540 [Tuber borchii]|uniref:Uncharacterized protein n=1 Tax=Tuber borchii TaxID=42251 RepID=A0A2T7A4U1_TUBBO|nr:hypothetical protein B9Z19DRAFT_327540 [Tuber borchii]